MLAVFITKSGSPEVVQVRKTSLPGLGKHQTLVKVHTAGINYADVIARKGLYPDAPKFPFIPGYEFAGVVEKSSGANRVKQGDRVLGISLFNAQAEYVTVNEDQLFTIPDDMNFQQAAAVPVNYLTAYFALFVMGNLEKSERVMIHSCAGGVGTAAVQLALIKNAEIFGTTSSEEKCLYLKKIKVAHPINYRAVDFTKIVEQIHGRHSIDLVLDPVGGPTFKKSYRVLAPGGRIISYGVADLVAGGRKNIFRLLWKFLTIPRLTTLNLIQNNRGVFGLSLNRLLNKTDKIRIIMDDLLKLFVEGKIKPEIYKEFQLQEISKAHALLESGKSMGKLIINFQE